MKMHRVLIVLAALAWPAVTHAQNQIIRGRLLEEGTGQPVVGGFVRLVNEQGIRVGEILSNASGAYHLSAPQGTYILRVERLGYQTYETPKFVLDGNITRDVTLPQVALDLPPITASAKDACGKDRVVSPAGSVLWQEIEKALDATSWTANAGSLTFELQTIEQVFDPSERNTLSETHSVHTGVMQGSPFAALDRDSLLIKGFVQKNDIGLPNYYGPDGELIMSEPFQHTHCFHAVADKKKDLVGLAFEPQGQIKPSDIRGVLWMDRKSHQLRRLEFSYDHLINGAPLSTAHGDVEFTRIAGGMWIVSDWNIYAPVMSNETHGHVLDQLETPTGKPTLVAVQKRRERALTAYLGDSLIYKAPDIDH